MEWWSIISSRSPLLPLGSSLSVPDYYTPVYVWHCECMDPWQSLMSASSWLAECCRVGLCLGHFREALTAWDLRSNTALRWAKEALWVQSREHGQKLSLVFLSGRGLWTQFISTSWWPPSNGDQRSFISKWEGAPNEAYDLNWKLHFQF